MLNFIGLLFRILLVKRRCLGRLLAGAALAFWCVQPTLAAVRIGSESALPDSTSAHYSSVMNVRPGPTEVVSNNPPIFSWFYVTNHMAGGEQNPNGFYPNVFTQTNAFQFQISTQLSFAGPLVEDVSTPMNFYNFLRPLNTNATRKFWWRVKYVSNNTPYWTNGPYPFTISANATNWDRSILADPVYRATNGVHPLFCFREGEQAGIWSWIQTQNPEAQNLFNRATAATNAAYFKNPAEWPVNASPNPNYAAPNPPDAFNRVNDLGAVLLLWTVSGDNRWTNASMTGWLVTNLAHVVNWHNSPSNNWIWTDYGQPAGNPQLVRLLCATYDWMYDHLGSDTRTFNGQLRTNALWGMKMISRFWTHNSFWSASPTVTGHLILTNGYDHYKMSEQCVQWSSWPKIGSSHITTDTSIAMVAAFVGQADDPDCGFAYEWILNYMLARTSPYAGFAAHHIGPFGYVDNAIFERSVLSGLMVIDVAYPQAQLRRTDFCQRFPEWYTRMLPYGQRKFHGAYGDGAPNGAWGTFMGDARRGFDLAAVSRSGLARQLWDLNREHAVALADNTAQWDHLPLRWHYRVLPAPETNTTSAVYPEDGYVMASQISPSEFGCYTNGVGFSMRASPRGSSQGHNIPANLAPDMWAYGAQLTDGGGAGLDEYSSRAAGSPGLFVNGYGEGDVGFSLYGFSPTVPVQARIVNFTNSGTDFVYTCADGTAMFTNSYHPLRTLVTKVKRHIFFVRSKYWIVYDEFAANSPATFAFRWHVPWAFRVAASGSALTNETAFTGNRFGSNSFAVAAGGFTYVAGNYADWSFPNPPRVPVHVQFANATNDYGIFAATGINALGAGTLNVMGTAATNSTLNPLLNRTYATYNPDRAAGLWVTNRTPRKTWELMTVIVPQRIGVAAPVITPLDESTVRVTYDGVTETTTFGTNYVGLYTYRIEKMAASKTPPGIPTGVRRQ